METKILKLFFLNIRSTVRNPLLSERDGNKNVLNITFFKFTKLSEIHYSLKEMETVNNIKIT